MTAIWSFSSFAEFFMPFYLYQMKSNIYYLSLATEGGELLASFVVLYVCQVMDLRHVLGYCFILIAAGSLCITFLGKS